MRANDIPMEFACFVRFTVIKFIEERQFQLCSPFQSLSNYFMHIVKEILTCPRSSVGVSHWCFSYPQHYNPYPSSVVYLEVFIVGPSLFSDFPQKV